MLRDFGPAADLRRFSIFVRRYLVVVPLQRLLGALDVTRGVFALCIIVSERNGGNKGQ